MIYKNDDEGNKYMPPEQMISKIKDELYIHGGRLSTKDLFKELNVDSCIINQNISEIVKGKEVQFIEGSLIAHYYLEEIAREINIKLQIKGKISLGDLALQFDLPADVLQHNVLDKYLGTIIIGKQDPSDPKLFYTEEYITRSKAKVRGALMGLLKPRLLREITNHCNLEEELFINIFDQLNDTGVISGRHDLLRAVYESSVYTKSQNDSLIRSYKLNNYLEYFTLEYYFIPYPKEYIKRILPNENMIFLKRCVIDLQLKQKLEAAVEEIITSKSYINVSSFLNIDIFDEDIETLLSPFLKKYSVLVFDNTVFSYQFIESIKEACLPTIKIQAESATVSGKYHQYLENQLATHKAHNSVDHRAARCEEHRMNASSGVEDGGLQNSNAESMAVKRHPMSQQLDNGSYFDESPNAKNLNVFEIINIKDIENVIKGIFENEYMDHVVTPIAEYILGHLNQTAFTIAKDLYEKLLQDE